MALRKDKQRMAEALEQFQYQLAEMKALNESLTLEKWQILEEKAKLQGQLNQIQILLADRI